MSVLIHNSEISILYCTIYFNRSIASRYWIKYYSKNIDKNILVFVFHFITYASSIL